MAHNLGMTLDSYMIAAVIILEVGVDSFNRTSVSKSYFLRRFKQNLFSPPGVRIYYGDMTKAPAEVLYLRRIIGGVIKIIAVGYSFICHLSQWNGNL